MNHIPYRGTAPAVTDLVAGTIPLMITTVASANAAIRDGPGAGASPRPRPAAGCRRRRRR